MRFRWVDVLLFYLKIHKISEEQLTRQENPYKFTVIGKDLQSVSVVTADFLVHDGQVAFITNDREGVMRIVSYDPAGALFSCSFTPSYPQLFPSGPSRVYYTKHILTPDPDSLNGERLILRTEYDTGSVVTVAKTIARRRGAEEEFAPQTQLIYCESTYYLLTRPSDNGRNTSNPI